jgi:hypothetical protein
MNNIQYKIKEVEGVPRPFIEIYSENVLVSEYQVAFPEDISKLDNYFIEEYSNYAEEKFNLFILDIKNDKDPYDKFRTLISNINEVLLIKKQCDSHIERMDIIE